MTYFLDANVFMYAAGKEHPLKVACLRVLKHVADESLEACTSTEVLQEILYRYARMGRAVDGIRLAQLSSNQVGQEVLPVTIQEMRRAFEILERYGEHIQPRDAVHAATMLNNSISHIVSTDTHFDLIEEVTRVPPEQVL